MLEYLADADDSYNVISMVVVVVVVTLLALVLSSRFFVLSRNKEALA